MQSIVAFLLICLFLPACGGKVRRFGDTGPLPLTRAFGQDPIVLPEGFSISRGRFRAHVARSLGSNWMSFLALDKAMAAEIEDRGLLLPDLELQARMRSWVRNGFLGEWLPDAKGGYRPEKAELDLARTLSHLQVVIGKANMDRRALERRFVREIRSRSPRLHDDDDEVLASCQGQKVHVMEVYPELSALIPAEERHALLYELAPAR